MQMKKYKPTTNDNLCLAKLSKNDEFYTQLSDIIKELKYYKDKFRDKIIYLPCDNPEFSQFYYYFFNKFKTLGLKKLIASFYSPKSLFDTNSETSITIVDNTKEVSRIRLKGDGDFRSKELIPYWKEADIIITNPPFSLFREFVDTISFYQKKFLIIGSLSAIYQNNVFNLFRQNKIFLGRSKLRYGEMNFISPDNKIKRVPVRWFTNIERYYPDIMSLSESYSVKDNPEYEDYPCIFVEKVKLIPKDYHGKVAVGATFIDRYNPEQFKIIDKRSLIMQGKQVFTKLIIQRV